MKGSKSYTFLQDYSHFDIARAIADFRREFQTLEPLRVNIAVEKEFRVRGMRYDFEPMRVEFKAAFVPPETIEIEVL